MGCAGSRDIGVAENVDDEHYRRERPPIERQRSSFDEEHEAEKFSEKAQSRKKKKGETWLMQARIIEFLKFKKFSIFKIN